MSTETAIETVRWDGELNAYLISGYDEASSVLRGTGWSSDPRDNPLAPLEMLDVPQSALVFMNPPGHTRLRSMLSPAFTPRAIERLRPRVAAIVDAVLDELDGQETADVLSEIGYLVPLAVITELLDAGVEGAELFRARTPDLFRLLEVAPTPADLRAGAEAAAELTFFLTPLIAERGVEPGADFISAMLAMPDGPTLDEVLATCLLLLAAGHETTANMVANGTYLILSEPGRRKEFLDDPARALAEVMRTAGSIKLVGRVAQHDQRVGDQPIKAGQAVIVLLHEVNRDPRQFTDPGRVDLTREPVPNLAFGAGPHFCLGAALARLEIAETLTRLLTRFPDMSLVTERPRWRASSTFHGLEELLVHPGPR